jgi:hypothetical protein
MDSVWGPGESVASGPQIKAMSRCRGWTIVTTTTWTNFVQTRKQYEEQNSDTKLFVIDIKADSFWLFFWAMVNGQRVWTSLPLYALVGLRVRALVTISYFS